MKLPNGFGSVYCLSGNRRRPWVVKKSIDGRHTIHILFVFYCCDICVFVIFFCNVSFIVVPFMRRLYGDISVITTFPD